MLGAIALQRGDAALAEKNISQALALRPQHPVALSNLGTALCRLDRWNEAIELYRRALALRPDFPDARKNLDVALRRVAPKQILPVPSVAPLPGPRGSEFMQKPFDCAVLMRTIMRPTLIPAIESVYAQDFKGRIQIVIGVDRRTGKVEGLDRLLSEKCPPNIGITVLDPGYSTSKRNGGLYSSRFGGSLLTALAYLANAPRVMCLDDDNRMCPDHVRLLMDAIGGQALGFLAALVHQSCDRRTYLRGPLGIGRSRAWRVRQQIRRLRRHEFMDRRQGKAPQCVSCPGAGAVQGWRRGRSSFFRGAKKHPHGETGKATSEYAISPGDQNFALRLRWFAEVGYDVAKISPAGKAMLIGSRPSASK